jgi:hypothetical protein
MKRSESITRFLFSEALLLAGIALSSIGAVQLAYFCFIFFLLPLQPWAYTQQQYTRRIVGREALWTAAATAMVIGAFLVYKFFAADATQHSSSWPVPHWLAVGWWVFPASLPVFWLIFKFRRNET